MDRYVKGDIVRKTEKAILLSITEYGDRNNKIQYVGTEVWIPTSQISDEFNLDESLPIEIEVPDWILRKNKLI